MTDMSIKEIRSTFDEARIFIVETAKLFGVSKATLHRWYKDGTLPSNKLHYSSIVELSLAVRDATEDGEFPLPFNLETGANGKRMSEIKRRLSPYLEKYHLGKGLIDSCD